MAEQADINQATYEADGERGEIAMDRFFSSVRAAVHEAEIAGIYMPGIATALRIEADAMAEKYPDDTNGGFE